MVNLDVSLELLPYLHGAPLTVLVALHLAGQPVSLHRLAIMTGYSSTVVERALGALADIGQVQRKSEGWTLLDPGAA